MYFLLTLLGVFINPVGTEGIIEELRGPLQKQIVTETVTNYLSEHRVMSTVVDTSITSCHCE